MCKWLPSLMGDEHPVCERIMVLAISFLGGMVLGMLLSPFRKTVVGSYNGSYNEGNSSGASL